MVGVAVTRTGTDVGGVGVGVQKAGLREPLFSWIKGVGVSVGTGEGENASVVLGLGSGDGPGLESAPAATGVSGFVAVGEGVGTSAVGLAVSTGTPVVTVTDPSGTAGRVVAGAAVEFRSLFPLLSIEF
jgi:hypothetical protein